MAVFYLSLVIPPTFHCDCICLVADGARYWPLCASWVGHRGRFFCFGAQLLRYNIFNELYHQLSAEVGVGMADEQFRSKDEVTFVSCPHNLPRNGPVCPIMGRRVVSRFLRWGPGAMTWTTRALLALLVWVEIVVCVCSRGWGELLGCVACTSSFTPPANKLPCLRHLTQGIVWRVRQRSWATWRPLCWTGAFVSPSWAHSASR